MHVSITELYFSSSLKDRPKLEGKFCLTVLVYTLAYIIRIYIGCIAGDLRSQCWPEKPVAHEQE